MSQDLVARAQALGSRAIETAVEASLPPAVRSSLVLRRSIEGGRILSSTIAEHVSRPDLEKALGIIKAALRPASRDFIATEVTRMLLCTRTQDNDDLRARIAIFCEELAHLPADAIQSGCRKWSLSNTWPPSLHELITICEKFEQERWFIGRALENALARLSSHR